MEPPGGNVAVGCLYGGEVYQGAGKSVGQGGGAEEDGGEDEERAHGRNVAG